MNRVRVGIAGFGTVGRATAEIISAHADLIAQRSGVRLEVTAVCRRSGVRIADIPVGARVFPDWNQLVAASDVDVTVETMGGTNEARLLVLASLKQGKPVVTANKNLVATHGDELFALAFSQNLPVGFEASVAGGYPYSTSDPRIHCGRPFTRGIWNSERDVELHPYSNGEPWNRVRTGFGGGTKGGVC
jgi:homoserine dehydrogenase